MKLSLNWLKEFVDIEEVSPQELANLLTMKTCEVEGFEEFMPHLEKILVAHIDRLEKHPDADKLKICQVNTGGQVVQIVTGADNVEQGKKFPVALVGITLPDGRTMQKAKLRGVESFGMLCSGSELGIQTLDYPEAKVDGLMPLPDSWQVGEPLSKYFGGKDITFDIDNKSITHRADLWCHFGFAREIAALLDKPLKFDPTAAEFKTTPSSTLPEISIEEKTAITYCGAELEGFQVAPSPIARQMRLLSIGQKPINNIVDISNYVLAEMGQPNHAFDRDKISKKISVSYSKAAEKITLLDGATHALPEKCIIIRDGEKAVALAGVMGGQGSETTQTTKKIFLESATFPRHEVRRTVAVTGVRSDSSQRFEKAQDPAKAKAAIFRFATLLAEEQKSITLSEIREKSTEDFSAECTIHVSNAFIDQKLGQIASRPLSNAQVLERLGFSVKESGDSLTVTVPSYRKWFDVTRGEDLVEEIGRFIGYKEITIEPSRVACETPRAKNALRSLEHALRSLCAHTLRLNENFAYAFHSEEDLKSDEHFAKAGEALALQNALQNDLKFLRISPMPGLLRAVRGNYREEGDVRLFEIEKIFLPPKDASLARNEVYFLAGAMVSSAPPEEALSEMASMVSEILSFAGLPRHEQRFANKPDAALHPGRTGVAGAADKNIFRFGEVHPRLLVEYGIKERVYYFDAILEDLLSLEKSESAYRPPFTHPAVEFDMTLVMPKLSEYSVLREAAGFVQPSIRRDLDKTVLVGFDYVSTFSGGNLKEDEKAVSVRATWRNPTRTLTAEEIKKLQSGIVAKMEKAGFALR